MSELAYLNGVFGPIEQAKVSIEDRGFQFGDGVYEVMVVYNGRPFLLAEHLQRLRRSTGAIGLEYDFDAHPIEPIIREGLRRSELHEAMVYLQITRGAAPRSHVVPEGITPTVVMTFKPLPTLPDELRRRGAKLLTAPDIRWARCSVKAITLLPNVLAKTEAFRRGCDDALFISADGEVRECTSSNIFMALDGACIHPPRTQAVLHGVTQAFLVRCARAIGIRMTEQTIDLEALHRADEVFLTGTAMDVLGVTSIDDQPVGTGRVGPLTQRLYQEFVAQSRGGGASEGGSRSP